jgi:hypothetical protein
MIYCKLKFSDVKELHHFQAFITLNSNVILHEALNLETKK